MTCNRDLSVCDADQLSQSAVRGGLGRRRTTLGCQLPERERGMPEAQLGDLAELGGKRAQPTFALELPDRADLCMRSAARTLEVCLVGVGESVGLRPRRRDDGV